MSDHDLSRVFGSAPFRLRLLFPLAPLSFPPINRSQIRGCTGHILTLCWFLRLHFAVSDGKRERPLTEVHLLFSETRLSHPHIPHRDMVFTCYSLRAASSHVSDTGSDLNVHRHRDDFASPVGFSLANSPLHIRVTSHFYRT